MFSFHVSVKPTVALAGDVTPDISDAELSDDQQVAPTGDLADLLVNVGVTAQNSKGPNKKKGKNKGVGKGCSGSSGPPPKRARKNNLVQQPANESSESESEEEIEVDERLVNSTQKITVGVKKGYSIYPGYLFDVPPKSIKLDRLRKQFMINKIARARAERRFYHHGMTFLSCCKEFLRIFAAQNNFPKPNFAKDADDHGYAMGQDEEMELSDSQGSNIDLDQQK